MKNLIRWNQPIMSNVVRAGEAITYPNRIGHISRSQHTLGVAHTPVGNWYGLTPLNGNLDPAIYEGTAIDTLATTTDLIGEIELRFSGSIQVVPSIFLKIGAIEQELIWDTTLYRATNQAMAQSLVAANGTNLTVYLR